MANEDMLKKLFEQYQVMVNQNQVLVDKCNQLLESSNRQEAKFDELKKRVDDHDQKIHKVDQKVDNMQTNIVGEIEQRIRNKSNVVIYGLPENDTEDMIAVQNLLRAIDVAVDVEVDMKRVVRFGNKPDVPRIAKVIFNIEQKAASVFSKYDKMNIEERKTKLGAKIFIDRDLTKYQMDEKRAAMIVKNNLNKEGKKSVIRYVNGRHQCFETKK